MMEYYNYFIGNRGNMKKIIILIMALMIGLSNAFAIDLIEGRKVELSELFLLMNVKQIKNFGDLAG